MRWIREHKLFSGVAFIVVALIMVVIISYLSAGGASVVGNGVDKILVSIQRPLASFTGGVKENARGIFKYQSLLAENERLKKENMKLENENIDLKLKRNEIEELNSLSDSFDFEPFVGKSSAIAGNIIAVNNSNLYDVFTIDVGKEKGLKKNDVVVDGRGLVGKITKVGDGYSKVTSILDYTSKISFVVMRDPDIKGVITGADNAKLAGYLLNEKASIVKGDVLVTSGIGNYPKGIKIGKVSEVSFDSDTQLKNVKVKPTVRFDSMQKVAVFK